MYCVQGVGWVVRLVVDGGEICERMCFSGLKSYVFIAGAQSIVCGGTGKVEHITATCVWLFSC